MPARRASLVATVLVAAAVLFVLVLATWASSIGPDRVLRGDGPGRATPPSPTASASASPSPSPGADTGDLGDTSDDAILRPVAYLFDALFVAVLLYLGVAMFRGLRRVRVERIERARQIAAEQVDFDVVDRPAAVAREMLDDADAQRQLLLGGTPRNAVVACWLRFEDQAAAAGLGRHPSETSSEFTMRLLDLVDADEPAVARLATLYREARFSEHELTEHDRRAALEALDAIHHSIGIPA